MVTPGGVVTGGPKQLISIEANKYTDLDYGLMIVRSRLVTMVRNLNERAFGRLTRCWAFLRRTLPSSLVGFFKNSYRLLLAVDNAFFPRQGFKFVGSGSSLEVLKSRSQLPDNPVQRVMNTLKFRACRIGELLNELPSDLTLKSLQDWNIGTYSARLAPYYLKHTDVERLKYWSATLNGTKYFKISNIASRFSASKKRRIILTFGGFAVSTFVYCSCACGMRTLGSCSHGVSMLYHLLTNREGVPETISRKRYIEQSPFHQHVVDISSWAKDRKKEKKGAISHNARATTLSVDLDPDIEMPQNAGLDQDQSEADLAAENEEVRDDLDDGQSEEGDDHVDHQLFLDDIDDEAHEGVPQSSLLSGLLMSNDAWRLL